MWKTLRSVLRFRRRARTREERLRTQAVNIEDLRRLALRRLPRGVFNYIDGGAEDEVTLRANSDAFRRWNFAPRVLEDVSQVDTSVTLLGRRLPFPLVLAPTGFARMADPEGELAVVRAAARAGLPFSLSTVATRSIEEVAAAADDAALWFQLYVLRDRGMVRDLVQRGRGCRLPGADAYRGHPRAGAPRARRAPRLYAAAATRSRHHRRRHPSIPAGPGASSAPIPSCSPTWAQAPSATARPRWRCPV